MDSRGSHDTITPENVCRENTRRTSYPGRLGDSPLQDTRSRQTMQNDASTERSSATSSSHHDWNHLWRKHHYHLWTSKTLPHRSTHAPAIAPAEAASWAQQTPLIAATLGPLAGLLGIPSLTQPWYGQLLDQPVQPMGASNFTPLPDPG